MRPDDPIEDFIDDFEGFTVSIEDAEGYVAQSAISNWLRERLEKLTTCQKPTEGNAICGCKLDCHLHDWRAR